MALDTLEEDNIDLTYAHTTKFEGVANTCIIQYGAWPSRWPSRVLLYLLEDMSASL